MRRSFGANAGCTPVASSSWISRRTPVWTTFLIFILDAISLGCIASSYAFHRGRAEPSATSSTVAFVEMSSPILAPGHHLLDPVRQRTLQVDVLPQQGQVLTLEFRVPIQARGAVLVADGWIEYPYSQTVFAAWQAGLRYRPASLEARGPDGKWRMIAAEFVYPAGMPRTMTLPLPNLPAGTDAPRLSSNMEIYWDRLRVVAEEPLPIAMPPAQPPLAARVGRTGFAKRTTGPQRLPHYEYEARALLRRQVPARLLYVIWRSGRTHLRYRQRRCDHRQRRRDPSRIPRGTAAGDRRFFAIEFYGWAKDMDLYTEHGDTVAPLPALDEIDPEALERHAPARPLQRALSGRALVRACTICGFAIALSICVLMLPFCKAWATPLAGWLLFDS